MLAERYADHGLRAILLPRERYLPYPTADDRAAWKALPDELRRAHVAAGEQRLGYEWPTLPATLFMEYRREGNRSRYEERHFARRNALGALVLAECMEGKGRFLDDIANGAWAICEESFWGVPAHSDSRRLPGTPLPDTADRVIDLFAAETAGLLAWTHYLLASRLDAVAPALCDRIRREVKQRILDPYLARDDFWWMAFGEPAPGGPLNRVNNWNPWCNSNCLTAFLLLEEDPERRLAAVDKALRSVDKFIEVYHPDGGCDEGTSYWDRAGGSLFDCLELFRGATGGRIDVYGEPLIANIGRYLYRAYIGGGDWFVNFADGGPRVGISADLVYRYGRRIGDDKLMALGAAAHRRRREAAQIPPLAGSLLRVLPALFDYAEIDAARSEPPIVRDVWLDGTEVMVARERAGSERGLYLAAKGGHNNENHNHNDVGHFIVYCDGEPVLIDVGVETYTAKTFSPRRYEIWTMQSAYHNLPTIDGVQQAAGRQFAARDARYACDDSAASLSLDIAGAYPPEAGVRTWRRTVTLHRSAAPAIEIRDAFELERPAAVALGLMAAREPHLAGNAIRLPGRRDVRLTFPTGLTATVEPIAIEDARLRPVWGDRLWRILLAPSEPVREGEWVVRVA